MAHSFDGGSDPRSPWRTRSRCKLFRLEPAEPPEAPRFTSGPALVTRQFGATFSIGALSQRGGPAEFRYLNSCGASPTRGSDARRATRLFFNLDAPGDVTLDQAPYTGGHRTHHKVSSM